MRGSTFEEPKLIYYQTKDINELLEQAEPLLKEEVSRAEETRKRSDQLLTRIIVVAPFLVGILVVALRNPRSSLNVIGLVGSFFAICFLLVSLFAILGNLGKEIFYQPIAVSDLIQGSNAAPMPLGRKVAETFASIRDRSQRNEDAIDRLHTSYAAVVVAIILGLIAGACVLAVPPPPAPPTTSAGRCTQA
ncbi:hypothetical protein WMF45_48940 [Sorangium sp. So ce448]|uniref:hypothetical protein n=1 Tax=Sorangium sp. So ce448 TaxID=3133314 RepID=UPI003F5F209B